MGAVEVFFDTNVLVYLTDDDRGRAARSEELLAFGGVVSVQVLNGVYLGRSPQSKLDVGQKPEILAIFRATLSIVPLTLEMHDRGLDLAERYGFNVYDAMIVAAAQLAGCTVLYTEDMHDGLVIDRLTIRNPYRNPPAAGA